MLGRVLNTHQQWLCRRLADLGYVVSRQVAVPDTGHDIEQAVKESLSRADLIITTGGLGPTSDDITRELIAKLLGKSLQEDSAVVAHIRAFFESRGREMPERTRVQALVPEGAIILANPHGTAPGLALHLNPNPFNQKGEAAWLIMLPGPPRELRPMFDASVVPLLKEELPLGEAFVCRTLRTSGIGESLVEERIAGLLESATGQGLEIGYCARPGEVDVRLVARGSRAEQIVREAQGLVRAELEKWIYAEDDDDLETILVRTLTGRKQTLALAESCTGGLIAHRITNVAGASSVLLAGLVTYSNAAKQKFLGVRAETLEQHGAVSEPVAREMAEGARKENGSEFALAVTGIAGPGGGTETKPVGTVFIALAGPFSTIVLKNHNPYDRETFKQITSQQALELLRRKLAKMSTDQVNR
jgi:nicotinamide-nucleotide amidase